MAADVLVVEVSRCALCSPMNVLYPAQFLALVLKS